MDFTTLTFTPLTVGDLDLDEGHVGDAPRLADGFARHRARMRRSDARRENSARAAFTPLTDQLTLTWSSMANKTYRLTTSSNLAPPWVNVAISIQGQVNATSATLSFEQST